MMNDIDWIIFYMYTFMIYREYDPITDLKVILDLL